MSTADRERERERAAGEDPLGIPAKILFKILFPLKNNGNTLEREKMESAAAGTFDKDKSKGLC